MKTTMYPKGYAKCHKKARKIMINHLGRSLSRYEIVHHKDGDWNNNELSNLELMTLSEHTTLHHAMNGFYSVRCNCINCGVELIRGKYKVDIRKNVFCSPKCYYEFIRIRPSKKELKKLLEEHNNNKSAIGRIFGVSCSAVRAWIKKYEI